MGFKISELKTDREKEEHGVWFPYRDGSRLKIARNSNPSYQAGMRRGLARARVGSPLDAEEINAISRPLAARFILLDWEGILDDDGNPIPYSHAAALQFFEQMPDFFDDVMAKSNLADAYRLERLEDGRKNLPASSNGT